MSPELAKLLLIGAGVPLAVQGMALTINFPVFQLPSIGTYPIHVTLDGTKTYKDNFSVHLLSQVS